LETVVVVVAVFVVVSLIDVDSADRCRVRSVMNETRSDDIDEFDVDFESTLGINLFYLTRTD
jgi:hypothetical protein